jgi:hypothetical protein
MAKFVFFDLSSRNGVIYTDRKMLCDTLNISSSTLRRHLSVGPYWGTGFVVFRAVEIESNRGKKNKK